MNRKSGLSKESDHASQLWQNKNHPFNPLRVSVLIFALYTLVGGLWIILSDQGVATHSVTRTDMTRISMVKGLGYVLVTGLVFCLVILFYLRRIRRAEIDLFKSNQELKVLAYTDPVSGLPNRVSFLDLMELCIESQPEAHHATMIIDLDNFKNINDTLGHDFGDQLITMAGERIRSGLLGSNSLFKLCGDEFVVTVHDYSDIQHVYDQADRILDSFNDPLTVHDNKLHATISMGVALYPEHGQSPYELVKCADIALYKAKENGKNRYVLFEPAMKQALHKQMTIEKNLRTALAGNEFYLVYQPQYDIQNKTLTGYEALIRWQNPELGFVSPMDFISIAEATYLIVPIGEWVLRQACIFMKRLHESGHPGISISVNISGIQLEKENFAEMVFALLDEIGLDPKCLVLEITESIMMKNMAAVLEKLGRLREKGVRIALDDFGKGYSSLNSVQQLALDIIKIDKSFIDSIPDQSKSNLIEIIIAIGHKLDLDVLAEGVETKEQLEYLVDNQCSMVQGYYLSRPLKQEDAAALLERPVVF